MATSSSSTTAEIYNLRDYHATFTGARRMKRKIIFHTGPPNSGKTYRALERYFEAKTAIYCGPLRLLANEVFQKTRDRRIPCDLVTGEEIRLADKTGGKEADHQACTIQMANLSTVYDVAVIDEMQMIGDLQNGCAWTRAFLGLKAKELHLCGEEAVLSVVQKLVADTKDELEIRKYTRLTTDIRILPVSLGTYTSVRPGDCIVCFSRKNIHEVVKQLKKAGIRTPAVIYGALPPGTKRKQAAEFNSRTSNRNVLVSTDAIGMGLNLNIRRVIFYSLTKFTLLDAMYGRKGLRQLTASEVQHIAGRAGRYQSPYTEGEVTTLRQNELSTLRQLMTSTVPPVERAGLIPTMHKMEQLSAIYPPSSSHNFSTLTQLFRQSAQYDSNKYFLCYQGDMTTSSNLLSGIDLTMGELYTFSSAPLPGNSTELQGCLTEIARLYSRREKITLSWLKMRYHWGTFRVPTSAQALEKLETSSDMLSLYLWLGNRYSDLFPDIDEVLLLQDELSSKINDGVDNLSNLLAPDYSESFDLLFRGLTMQDSD